MYHKFMVGAIRRVKTFKLIVETKWYLFNGIQFSIEEVILIVGGSALLFILWSSFANLESNISGFEDTQGFTGRDVLQYFTKGWR